MNLSSVRGAKEDLRERYARKTKKGIELYHIHINLQTPEEFTAKVTSETGN